MPIFSPPVVDDVGPVPADWVPVPPIPYGKPAQRLFAHMKSRARGRTVLLLKAGGCAIFDYPVQQVPPWQGEGDPFTETGIGGYAYTDIDRVFLGGHIYYVTDAEATRLINCGYGGGITYGTWGSLSSRSWGSLNTWEAP